MPLSTILMRPPRGNGRFLAVGIAILSIVVLTTGLFSPPPALADGCPLSSPTGILLKAQLRGNMLFPQLNGGIQLALLAQFLKDPVPARFLFEVEESQKLINTMNRAHHLHGVNTFTSDSPHASKNSNIVDRIRGVELTRSFRQGLAFHLLLLIKLFATPPGLDDQIKDMSRLFEQDPDAKNQFYDERIVTTIDRFFKDGPSGVLKDLRELGQIIDAYLATEDIGKLSKEHLDFIEHTIATEMPARLTLQRLQGTVRTIYGGLIEKLREKSPHLHATYESTFSLQMETDLKNLQDLELELGPQ